MNNIVIVIVLTGYTYLYLTVKKYKIYIKFIVGIINMNCFLKKNKII